MRTSKVLITIAAAWLPVLASAADLAALIRDGERKDALALIANGADVNVPQPDGTTPLMWAVNHADHELVDQLLKHGAKPVGRNVLGVTALTEAVETNDSELVMQMLQAGADPNVGNDDDQMPLMLAARAGSLPMVEALVEAGAKINTREKYRGQSALMWAVGNRTAGAAAVTDFLIQHGAEVDFRADANDWGNQITGEPRAQYRPTGGMTPLLYATVSGCLDCAKSLVKAGADINRPTPDGVTPLMNAIDAGNYDIVNFLLDQGANPHLQDWWGRTAIYVAIDMHSRGGAIEGTGGGRGGARRGGFRGAGGPQRGGGPPGGFPGRAGGPPGGGSGAAPSGPQYSAFQVAQRLLEMGVNPNTQLDMHRPFLGRFTDDLMTTGCTPLLRAAIGFDKEAVELLLKHGAIVDLPNVMGVTPLMAASGIGWGGVGGSGPGQSPVFYGARARPNLESEAIEVLKVLLAAGADINARITDTSSHTAIIARPSSMSERQGQTAIFGAIGAGTVNETAPPRNWLKLTQFLIDNGARLDITDARGRTLIDALVGLEDGEQISRGGGRDSASTPEMAKLIKEAMGVP
jgi:ankyrin repeat protein